MTAVCAQYGHNEPMLGCRCGIYATSDRAHLVALGYHRYHEGEMVVIGEVLLWGVVIEATHGWRAQYAYPKSLEVPYEIARLALALRDEYGVRVRFTNLLRLDDKEDQW